MDNQNTPDTMSQTGSLDQPIQVENVQYGVGVEKYSSKASFVFNAANISIAASGFILASILHRATGFLFGFSEVESASYFRIEFSILIPLAIIAFISVRRLYVLLQNSAAYEDILFKRRLRLSFRFFLVLAILASIVTLFNTLGVFSGDTDGLLENSSISLFYGGGLVLMSLWLYSLHKNTNR